MSDVKVPHTGRARMVHAIESVDGETVVVRGRVPEDHALAIDGCVPSATLFELGAQAAAAAAGHLGTEAAGERPGRVVSLRALTLHTATIEVGREIPVQVRALGSAGALHTFSFRIPGVGEGEVGVWLEA